MTLTTSPPTLSEASAALRLGSSGWPVYALQGALSTAGVPTAKDGTFGPGTKSRVEQYQRLARLVVDGIVGPATKARLSREVCQNIDEARPNLPQGLALGMATGEGGLNFAAVNTSVPGGVDCGLFQWRVLGPPYSQAALAEAFSPFTAGQKAMARFEATRAQFLSSRYAWSRGNRERAGRCALLAHNWPAGAEAIARTGQVSQPSAIATWATGVKFPDGTPVRTWSDWAQFYAMGGPHGSGIIASSVRSW